MQQGEGHHETLPEMWLVSSYSMCTEWNISWSKRLPEHESSLQTLETNLDLKESLNLILSHNL